MLAGEVWVEAVDMGRQVLVKKLRRKRLKLFADKDEYQFRTGQLNLGGLSEMFKHAVDAHKIP